MNNIRGFSLLELVIALGISAMIFLIIDSIYLGLWKTRGFLEQAHEAERARTLPQQIFTDQLFHAGHLGCRAVRDGIEIKAPKHIPESFFIHLGQALRIEEGDLWLHETFSHGLSWTGAMIENTLLAPVPLQNKSDWLLISDCLSAELLPYGGRTTQTYQPPIKIFPVIIKRWSVKNQSLTAQQVYPPKPSQPMLTPVLGWEWERTGNLMRLFWTLDRETTEFIFELGNS